MSELAERIGRIAKEHLGPAAEPFLRRELDALGVTLDGLRELHLPVLAERAERTAARVMSSERAATFAKAIRASAGPSRGPDAETFRTVAREALAKDNLDAAASALREGAAALTRANDRASARALLEQAVAMAPADLAAHRRFAAALVNAGDVAGACAEHARFIEVAITRGDVARAWMELTYAREMLGEEPALLAVAEKLVGASAAPASVPQAAAVPEPEPVAVAAAPAERPAAPQPSPSRQAAASASVDEAERLLAAGKLQAATDLLLDLVAHGSTDRRAQRLLIDVGCRLGRRDVAKDKCRLLGLALRLDGRADVAGDVERLASLI
ncbi:MAG TPA: hypothetical protein VFM93_05330 [Candidatus Limnocylindria bacterium]|nr:hypothetical protein [Candidatus Limnocylindria bacterium]